MTLKNRNKISYALILLFVLIAFSGILLYALGKVDTIPFILMNISVALGILAQKMSIKKRNENT
jgi:cytochrome b subunit of formate dehydrogenase